MAHPMVHGRFMILEKQGVGNTSFGKNRFGKKRFWTMNRPCTIGWAMDDGPSTTKSYRSTSTTKRAGISVDIGSGASKTAFLFFFLQRDANNFQPSCLSTSSAQAFTNLAGYLLAFLHKEPISTICLCLPVHTHASFSTYGRFVKIPVDFRHRAPQRQ